MSLREPTHVSRARRFVFDNVSSTKINQYLSIDVASTSVGEIREIQTETLPYEFQVRFFHDDMSQKDYTFDFKVNKTSKGFEFVLPITKI